LLSNALAALRQLGLFGSTERIPVECFGECDRQNVLIGSVYDLKALALPLFALPITFGDHRAGCSERLFACSLKVRMRDALWVVDDAAPGLDVEVVQSRFRLVLGCEGGRVGEVTRARCTTLIVPPLEIVTLAPSLLSVAQGTSPRAGLTGMPTRRAWRGGSPSEVHLRAAFDARTLHHGPDALRVHNGSSSILVGDVEQDNEVI
jgi:hypothetical protein